MMFCMNESRKRQHAATTSPRIIISREPMRSISAPTKGAAMPLTSERTAKAKAVAPWLQPNSLTIGLKIGPRPQKTAAERMNSVTDEAPTTIQPS